MMKRRTILYMLSASCLAACERTTAPQALRVVDEVETKLWQDWSPARMAGVGEGNVEKIWLGFTDRSTIVVTNNGATDQLNAAVIERVVIPPDGGGAPISRRSLVAWSQKVSYGIMAVTQTGTDESQPLGDAVPLEDDAVRPRPVLVAPRVRYEDWWVPGSGSVAIEAQGTADRCPFADVADESRYRSSANLTCAVATYAVRASGDLVRREDKRNKLLPDAMKRYRVIVVALQQVKGIRFSFRCPAKHRPWNSYPGDWYASACEGLAYGFWRSNALFASSLGVDLSQMDAVKLQNPVIYIRTLRRGAQERRDAPPLVRWTLWYPDGTLAERDSTVDDRGRVWLGQCAFFGSAYEIGYGGRRQCLVPQIGDPKMRSRFGVFVLDMESPRD